MRIRTLDPHWKKMDPDLGNFFKIYWVFLTENNFQIFLSFFSLIFILKLDKPFRNEEIFYNLSFFKSSNLGFRIKKVFFCSLGLIFYPLDQDLDPGSQNLADPTIPDPKHWFVCLFVCLIICSSDHNSGTPKPISLKLIRTI